MKTNHAWNKSLSQRCIKNYTDSEKGESNHEGIKDYCCKAVIAACTENVSMAVLV